MFHDTPEAKSLMKYLVTAPAQDIWVKARRRALGQQERHELPGRHRQAVGGAPRRTPRSSRFDASDLMPTAMNNAFWKAIVDYVKDPSKLDSILTDLDKVQADAYKAP